MYSISLQPSLKLELVYLFNILQESEQTLTLKEITVISRQENLRLIGLVTKSSCHFRGGCSHR